MLLENMLLDKVSGVEIQMDQPENLYYCLTSIKMSMKAGLNSHVLVSSKNTSSLMKFEECLPSVLYVVISVEHPKTYSVIYFELTKRSVLIKYQNHCYLIT
jgi:hypothetical protein